MSYIYIQLISMGVSTLFVFLICFALTSRPDAPKGLLFPVTTALSLGVVMNIPKLIGIENIWLEVGLAVLVGLLFALSVKSSLPKKTD